VSVTALSNWLLGLLGDSRAWYDKALADVRDGGPAGQAFAVAWSGCGRRLGKAPLMLAAADRERLRGTGVPFVPAGWATDEAGRALLLLAALEDRRAEPSAELVAELFARSEMREQQAVLRVLAYLPDPAQHVPLAADAVRSNVLSVLEALACDNPFPARHMPDPAFNQMIMKAIFNGLPLRRIEGLSERNNPELRRMVSAFASERRAAGRPVPADVDFILGGTPNASV
jgi:hypothetical protein